MNIVLVHAAFFLKTISPPEGSIGVDLFFMMGGFVIADRYDSRLETGLPLVASVRTRLIRLYPLFALGTVVGALPALAAVLAGLHDNIHWRMLASLPSSLMLLPFSSHRL